jgi:DNA invertase Pin-like site-specific DNA recombinase
MTSESIDCTKAVIYGVKSSPDEKESVTDQHRQVRAAIEREGGREVVGPFGEANQSGYRKERGPELEAAMRAAIAAARKDGKAELWVWHSSRLARGDGTKGRRSIAKVVHDLLYENVTVRSISDPEMVSPMLAGIASKTSNQYAADLSAHIKRGMRHRRDRERKPVGAVAFGWKAEPVRGSDGMPMENNDRVLKQRVEDPKQRPVLVQILERTVGGALPGDIACSLNHEGIRTQRGKPFTARSIRMIVENEAYAGAKGYPALVSKELSEAAKQALHRTDPAAKQRGRGGRPHNPAYFLRGFSFCRPCSTPEEDVPFYTRTRPGGKREYVCRERHNGTGLCHCPAIPAELLEQHVMAHLGSFTDEVEGWLNDQIKDHDRERTERAVLVGKEKAELRKLERKRDKKMAQVQGMELDENLMKIALEVVSRMDDERDKLEAQIIMAEVLLEEWAATPDVDAALDFYGQLLDVVQGRIREAPERGLNEALAGVFEGLWCELRDGRLLVDFALREPGTDAPQVRRALPVGGPNRTPNS